MVKLFLAGIIMGIFVFFLVKWFFRGANPDLKEK
jgi:hypothetical protein